MLISEHDGTGYTNFLFSKVVAIVVGYVGYAILNKTNRLRVFVDYLDEDDNHIDNNNMKDFIFISIAIILFLTITFITIFNYGL